MQPLQQIEWFGNPRGYNITCVEIGTDRVRSETIEDPTANSHIIADLEEYALYEISMQAYNDVGSSSKSPRALERTRESGRYYKNLGYILLKRANYSQLPFKILIEVFISDNGFLL